MEEHKSALSSGGKESEDKNAATGGGTNRHGYGHLGRDWSGEWGLGGGMEAYQQAMT